MPWMPGEISALDIEGYIGDLPDIVGDVVRQNAGDPSPAATARVMTRAMQLGHDPGTAARAAAAHAAISQAHGLRSNERIGIQRPDVARRQLSPMPVIQLGAATAGPPVVPTTASLTTRPMRPLRIERIVLVASKTAGGPASTGSTFITQLVVGAEPQFVNAGAVPIEVFAFNAVGVVLQGNTVNPGIDLTFDFANFDSTSGIVIGGTIIGTSLTN